MASAMESEVAALFINPREAVPLRITLEEMGHTQQPTNIHTDNVVAQGMVTWAMIPRRSKSMDMRFHWLKCREAQRQFLFQCTPAATNWADYFTKHFSPVHHRALRSTYVTDMQGQPTKYLAPTQ